MSNEIIVNEAYYGKLPEFIEIEKLFESMSNKMKVDPKKCNPNKYPENKKVEKLFCKVFGFKKTYLYWEPFNQANGYTLSLNSLILFSDKKNAIIKRSDTGFYDESGKSILTVYLSNGLILRDGLTPPELTATILHEIGHNFDISKFHLIEYMIDAVKTLGTSVKEYGKLDIDKVKEDYYDKTSDENDYYYNHSTKRDHYNKITDKRLASMYKINTWLSGILAIHTINFTIAFSPFLQFARLGSKKSEIFADSFASAYGYSVDLISALKKLDKEKELYYKPKTGFTRFLYDLDNFNTEVFLAFSDCHGMNQERCKDCLKKLNWDLNHNDFPPELKQELINKINETKKIYDSFVDKSEYDRMPITRAWHIIVKTIFGGRVGLAKFFPRHQV